jgi:hypothetical protein
MAEQPSSSDKFSEYVNLYYSQLTGGQRQPSGEPTPFPDLPAPKQKLGFLGRTVDILSRPMRILSNPAMKLVESAERSDKVRELRLSGDTEAATKESLSILGSLVASPFTGFFSDDPSNKPYWSDIVEKFSDVTNRNDPNYVDVANNVDPKLKGALGFVGDVVLDPLWLVPGGWGLKAAKEAGRGTEAITGAVKAADVPGAVARGAIPEAAMLPSMSGARNLGVADSVLSRTAPTFDLIVDGKAVPQKFPTKAAAEEFLETIKARSKRPLVNEDAVPKVFRGSRGYKIQPTSKAAATADVFPAAQAAQKVSDDLLENAAKGGATSSESVIKSLREIIDAKTVTVGGKTQPLRGELNSFFESLSKVTSAPAKAAKPGKPKSFDKWLPNLKADTTLAKTRVQIPNIPELFNPFGSSATLGNILDVFTKTKDATVRQAINDRLLRPAYERYAAGLKSAKDVDLIGNATTPTARIQEAAEASVAATIVRNLKNLDDAERARGAALLGDDLFADLQRFDPQGMSRFLDEIDVVLKNTGAIDAAGAIGSQTFLGRTLSLFASDDVLRRAAEAQLARNIDDIPNVTPESLVADVERVSQSADMSDFIRNVIAALDIEGNQTARINAIQDAMSEVLPDVIRAKLDPKYQKRVYKYRRGQALKTEQEFAKGRAVVPKAPNTGFQAEIAKDFEILMAKNYAKGSKNFLGQPNGSTFQGAKLIAEKQRNFIIAMAMAEELLKRQGLALTFNLNGVNHKMTLSESYRIVLEGMENSRSLSAASFNAFSPVTAKKTSAKELFDGTLPHGVFANAVAAKMAGGSIDDITAELIAKVSAASVPIVNGLADAAKAGRSIKYGKATIPATKMIEDIAKGIDSAGPALNNAAVRNAEEYAARGLVEGKQLSAEAAEMIVDTLRSPLQTAAQIRLLKDPTVVVDDIAGVVPTTELGQTIAKGIVSTGVGPEVSKAADLVDNIVTASAKGDAKAVANAQAALGKNASESAERIMDDAARVVDDLRNGRNPYAREYFDDIVDEFDISAVRPHDRVATEGRSAVTAMALKIIDPTQRFFDAKHGMHTKELLWGSRLFFGSGNKMALLSKPFITSLKNLMRVKEYSDPVVPGGNVKVLEQAFKNVQSGTRSAEGSVLRKAEDDIRPLMSRFFDQTDDMQNVLLGNAFFRTGAGREAFNDVFEYNAVLGKSGGAAKLPPNGFFFDQDLAFKSAAERLVRRNEELVAAGKKPGRTAPTQEEITGELLNQWKTWDVEDPIGFMYAVNRAMVQLSSEVSFITQFKQKAIELGLGGNRAQTGFVKIVADGDSRYGKLLGDEPFYMSRDVAEMFQAIDNFAKSTKQFEGGFGKLTRTVIDPLTDTWKYAITLPRPGHHIRNMVGDITLTYLAEGIVGATAASTKAWQLMSFRGSYPDIDIAKALTRNGITDVPKSNTVISTGQLGSFTTQDIFEKLLLDKGILIPARQREGLLNRQNFTNDAGLLDDDLISNRLSRVAETAAGVVNPLAIRGGKIEDTVLSIAEGRDTYIRIQHAMQMLEKAQKGMKLTRGYGTVVDPKKMTTDELFDVIAERVSKYHPDMATLSIQEKKYLRRIMPFYHWNRGAIQAVSETLLMNPGRVVALNKASYNIAVAAGINPDSLYDPFPDDQLFPSFLRDQMEGPLFEADGRYFGVRPGIATFDVMNQFASGNPIDTVLDNGNPLFKIPIELLTGTRLGTQSRIRDYSDYIDSNIPGLNYVANISGQSVTGSFYSLLTGGGFDPQYQFELGNKDSRDQIISAVNWLTGIGLTDYSRPSYIRFAEIEQQQERREQRGF